MEELGRFRAMSEAIGLFLNPAFYGASSKSKANLQNLTAVTYKPSSFRVCKTDCPVAAHFGQLESGAAFVISEPPSLSAAIDGKSVRFARIKHIVTIPKAIRDHLHLEPGGRIKFFVHPEAAS
jgi:AbrB family looped-hinge helix DNA binding protein